MTMQGEYILEIFKNLKNKFSYALHAMNEVEGELTKDVELLKA